MEPDQYTIEQKLIDVGDGHQIYTYLWGNKNSDTTIVFVHAGPGRACSEHHKSYFNPDKQRVLFFDQRGCGRSLPYGSLVDNNTDKLIDDINKITEDYGIEKFAMHGGSWGACLALAYTIKNPNKVTGLVISSIFTARKAEIDYLDKGEFVYHYPEVWADFIKSVPSEYIEDPLKYHLPRITGKNPEDAKKSAYAYAKLEGSVVGLDDRQHIEAYEDFDPVPMIIECYYLENKCFLPDNFIISNAHNINIPVAIVQGRYDMICPPITAFELHQSLPNSRLYITTAGHSGSDRANWDLVKSQLDVL